MFRLLIMHVFIRACFVLTVIFNHTSLCNVMNDHRTVCEQQIGYRGPWGIFSELLLEVFLNLFLRVSQYWCCPCDFSIQSEPASRSHACFILSANHGAGSGSSKQQQQQKRDLHRWPTQAGWWLGKRNSCLRPSAPPLCVSDQTTEISSDLPDPPHSNGQGPQSGTLYCFGLKIKRVHTNLVCIICSCMFPCL